VDAYRRILFRGFSQEEIETFATMVERLTANLESSLEPGKPDKRCRQCGANPPGESKPDDRLRTSFFTAVADEKCHRRG
jgi:hypothetical protein